MNYCATVAELQAKLGVQLDVPDFVASDVLLYGVVCFLPVLSLATLTCCVTVTCGMCKQKCFLPCNPQLLCFAFDNFACRDYDGAL